LPTLLLPIGLTAAFALGLPSFVSLRDFGIFFTCWLLGFAQHDGLFAKVGRRITVPVGAALIVVAASFLFTHPGSHGYDLNQHDLAQCLWSVGFVILVFAFAPPSMDWLRNARPLAWLVKMINQRSVTIYLWHLPVVVGLSTAFSLAGLHLVGPGGLGVWLLAVFAGVAVCAMAFGWVEDLAARRRPALVPVA
jgi:hypothetical protein